MTPTAVLKNYFGLKPNQTLAEFASEIRALTADEKKELVELAAIQLGVEVTDK